MNSVPTLFDTFDIPRARQSDPLPSHEAADRTATTKTAVTEAVRSLLWDAGYSGLTDDELNAKYAEQRAFWGWPVVDVETPRRRRSDLTVEGVVSASGVRRPNRHGKQVTVWVLTQYQKAVA